jgi:hypothetical protein
VRILKNQPFSRAGEGFVVRIIAACALAFMLAGCVAKSPVSTDEERNESYGGFELLFGGCR